MMMAVIKNIVNTKIMSNNKGNYYKRKTKKWLEEKGFEVEYIERYQRFFNKKNNSVGYIKQDLFGSDMLAIKEDQIIFVQSKYNEKSKSKNVASAIKEFKKHKFPEFTDQWIVVWTLRVREPDIIDVGEVEEN